MQARSLTNIKRRFQGSNRRTPLVSDRPRHYHERSQHDHFSAVGGPPESERKIDRANEVVGEAQQAEPDVIGEARRIQVARYDTEG
jgi:hypothetical protein